MSSTTATMYGPVCVKPWTSEPALALDDGPDGAVLELDDLGDLGQRPDLVQLARASMSSCFGRRWVTSAIGPPSATAALSALTLFSRPTWSGTIISGKMTVSRSATRGNSRGPVLDLRSPRRRPSAFFPAGVLVGHQALLGIAAGVPVAGWVSDGAGAPPGGMSRVS